MRNESNIVTLGEGGTPLLCADRLGAAHGFEHLYIKEEGLNPTGSFEARGMAVAVSRALKYWASRSSPFPLPDAIIYPTGGGTGIIEMWKAFEELEQLGWIGSRRPKMISVQANGCAPVVRAFESNRLTAEPWQNAATIADGLRVPHPFAGYLILDAIRSSRGTALAVSDTDIRAAMSALARQQGLSVASEGAATYAGFKHLVSDGFLQPNERIVLFNTGAGLKYPSLVKANHNAKTISHWVESHR